MDNQSVIAFCTYETSTFVVSLVRDSTMDGLLGALWEKWPDLKFVPLILSYAMYDHCNIILDSDVDMSNMVAHHIEMNVNRVNIVVKTKQCCIVGHEASKNTGLIVSSHDVAADDVDSSVNASCTNDERIMLSDRWSTLISHVGQKFEGGAPEFRVQLSKYAIEHGFQFTYKKNDLVRVTAICAIPGCPWRVHASTEGQGPAFYIKNLKNEHSCGGGIRTLKHPRVNSKLVYDIVTSQVRDKPLLRPKDIQHQFKVNYGIDISYFHAWNGKEKALKEVHGDDALSYDQLRLYCDSIRNSNPGSHCVLDFDHVTGRFQRLFIAYGACVHGFQFCRPMIFLDGTFLKGKYKGVLLSATGKNGNQGMFPLAIGIVDAENENNWIWFLKRLSEIVSPDRTMTFISDRNKGLLEAVPMVFPNSFHGFCLQHLKQNLRERISVYKGNKYRNRLVNLFSSCAHAPTYDLFLEKLTELKNDGGEYVANFLQSLPFENWANAYFRGYRYGEMNSNVAESFNSWILDTRHLPITQMVDHIRVQIMNMMAERLIVAKKWSTYLCPEMERRLKEVMKVGRHWNVSRSSEYVFEVHSCPPVAVNLQDLSCGCRQWFIHGFPCSHAAIAIQKNGDSVYKYCDPYYTTAYFMQSYSRPIMPVLGFEKPYGIVDGALIKPPLTRRPPGRPKKKRVTSFGQDKKLIRCTRCKKLGSHNRRSCKAPIAE